MSSTQLSDNELRTATLQYTYVTKAADAVNTMYLLARAGEHPRCRWDSGQAIAFVYASAATVLAVCHEDGSVVASATGSTTVFTSTAFASAITVAGIGSVFERNEPIYLKITTQGSATNVTMANVSFITVPYTTKGE